KLFVYNSGDRNQSVILDGASGTSPSIVMRSNSTDRAGIRWNNSGLSLGITNNYGSIDLTPGSGGSPSSGMRITPTGAGVGNVSPRVLLDVGTSSDAPTESSGLVGFFSTGGTARVSVRDST